MNSCFLACSVAVFAFVVKGYIDAFSMGPAFIAVVAPIATADRLIFIRAFSLWARADARSIRIAAKACVFLAVFTGIPAGELLGAFTDQRLVFPFCL